MQRAVRERLGNSSGVMGTRAPDPEVVPKATRRRFTAAYKQRILAEVDACEQQGEIGAVLRREGLYSSHIATWRKQRDEGSLRGLTEQKRGRKGKSQVELEVERLRKENERLQRRLRQAEGIVELQKKVFELLGETPPTPENGGGQ